MSNSEMEYNIVGDGEAVETGNMSLFHEGIFADWEVKHFPKNI